MDAIQEEIQNYERIVPFADEATMVLKAHLLLEQSLWKLIAARIADPALIEGLRGENSGVRNGKALVQLAQALAARDEVPMNNGDKIWPALYQLNSLRNRLAHELEPDRKKIEKYMRDVSTSLLGNVTGNLNRDFYHAALLLLAYLGIERQPMTLADTE